MRQVHILLLFFPGDTSSLAALSLMSDGRGGFTGASYSGLDADSLSWSLASSRSGHELNFFCFLFVKSHWFAWKANQWPLGRELLFSFVPPSNSLVSVSDNWRAFWADMAPYKGPWLASCIASRATEIQGHRQVCRGRHEGPRTLSITTDANLDC